MNRIEFMDRLTWLLADLPENERGEAIQYYNDYLDDAGVENEQEVLDALGTPEQLAATIREGLSEENADCGEFSEKGFTRQEQDSNELPSSNAAHRRKLKKTGMSTGALILLILCCICAAPILLPLALALAVAAAAVILIVIVTAVTLLFSGVICIAAGLWALFTAIVQIGAAPAGAMLAVGISLMCIGLGILLVLGMLWVIGRLFPTVFRGCVNFCSRLFKRKGGKQV